MNKGKRMTLVALLPLAFVLSGCGQLSDQQFAQGLGTALTVAQGLLSGLATQPGTNGAIANNLQASFLPGQTPAAPATTGTAGTTGTASTAGAPTGTPAAPTGNSAAANVTALLAAGGATRGGSVANDGRLAFTQYGGPSDRTPDANTQRQLGNRNNTLRSTSLALSPNLIREYGLRGGEQISIAVGGRTFFLGTYDDTTGSQTRNNVIDVYDPTDSLGRDNFMANVAPGAWRLVVGSRSV
jgi:hypothetical protein